MGATTENAATEVETSGFSGLFVAPTAKELDEILDQFEVQELIGQGGMGAVYRARQTRLDRLVAIKLLPAFAKGDPDQHGERFEREARAMAQLNHPNIVTVHDFGETEAGHRYIIMEYVDGPDMHALIQGGKLSTKHALAWVPQICGALEYAHSKNIVHRDIKPANILISKEGDVKVGDFGLAKLLGKKYQNAITQTQAAMGTPDYAAPEALEEGSDVDRRADIYSLGVLFYELLTAKVPRGAWRPPSAFIDIDVRVDQIIVKAMQPDPNHRYQDIGQITTALREMRSAPKVEVPTVPKVVAAKPKTLLTGLVTLPSKVELEQLLAENHRVPQKSGARPETRVGSSRSGMNPLVVAGIALGAVFLVIGLILMIAAGDSGKKSKEPPPVIVEKPEPEPINPGNPIVEPPTIKDPKNPDPSPQAPRLRIVSPGDGWVDILADLDLDEGAGVWKRNSGGGLELDEIPPRPGGRAQGWMPFPYAAGPAYELEFSLEPSAVKPIAIHLPTGPSESVLFLIGSQREGGDGTIWAGLSQVEGKDAFEDGNPTKTELSFEAGKPIKLAIRVVSRGKRTGIIVQHGGEDVLRWSGRSAELKLRANWKGLGGRRIAIGSQTPILVHSASMRALPRFVDIPDVALEPQDESHPWVNALAIPDVAASIISGDWKLEAGVLKMSEKPETATRPRFELPLVPLNSYEIEFRLKTEIDGDVVFLLPIDDQHFAPLHLSASGDTSGLDLATAGISAIGNSTAMPSPIETGESHLGLIQVRRKDDSVQIAMKIDGTSTFSWIGIADELPTDTDWPVRDKTRVTVGATAVLQLEFIRIRGVDPKSIPEMPMTPPELDGVQLRLTELEGKFGEELATKVDEVFQGRVNGLSEQYNAALNTLIEVARADGDLPLEAAAERERDFLRGGGEMPAEDPPEMPEKLKMRRAVYRDLMADHLAERAELALPIYREYAEAISGLILEYAALQNEDAVVFITKTKKELDANIEQLLESVDLDSAGSTSSTSPPTDPDVPAMAAVLQRPEFPIARPDDRGKVIAFSRKDEPMANPEVAEIPAGLSTTVVAIAGGPDVTVALKSNGRIEVWGAFTGPVPVEIADMSRLTKVAISNGDAGFHFAGLNEDGELNFYADGWDEEAMANFKNQAQLISMPVDFFIVPSGGMAVKSDGGVGIWGPVGVGGPDLSADFKQVVKLAAGPGIVAGIQEDGSVIGLGPGAGMVTSQAEKAREIAFGTQAETGAVILLPDRTALAVGDFARHQESLAELTDIQKIVAGYYGFAVDVGNGDWKFFGRELDPEFCAEQAKGCIDLVIGRDYVIGLQAN
ncbi:MAG: serine/threonine protein kinase [Verrucomicrobiales bacterium]|jgi:serine/threonine protein kinase